MELVVAQAIRKAKLPPVTAPVSVRLVWYAPSAHNRDVDGLAPTLKACLDTLVKEKVLRDDGYKVVHEVHLGPIVVAREDPRMELHIRELAGGGAVPDCGPGDILPG